MITDDTLTEIIDVVSAIHRLCLYHLITHRLQLRRSAIGEETRMINRLAPANMMWLTSVHSR